jgi:acetylornithine deacetylase/succinyl-diaminopimelate desuccinylase-like protein
MLSLSDQNKSAFIRGLIPASISLLSLAATLVLSVQTSRSQVPVRDYRRAHERQILDEFTRLLAIPNIASDAANIRRNSQFILEMMQRRGLNPRLLEAKSKDTPPAVYGEWKVAGATRSIILYAHYDGQPVDPKQWTASPPFQPTWRSAAMESGGLIVSLPATGEINSEWRIYARGASDDKAGVMGILTAFDALRVQKLSPSVNLKFLFEGEEEAGSVHLGEIIDLNKELLQSDAWIICDGPVHQSGASRWSLACAAIRTWT